MSTVGMNIISIGREEHCIAYRSLKQRYVSMDTVLASSMHITAHTGRVTGHGSSILFLSCLIVRGQTARRQIIIEIFMLIMLLFIVYPLTPPNKLTHPCYYLSIYLYVQKYLPFQCPIDSRLPDQTHTVTYL